MANYDFAIYNSNSKITTNNDNNNMNKQCLRPTAIHENRHGLVIKLVPCSQFISILQKKALGPVYIRIRLITSDHPKHFIYELLK